MTDSLWQDGRLPNNEFRVANLIMLVEQYMSADDAKKVYEAFIFAAEAHDGVMRKDGSPYITHPLEVARTLADLHMDADVICAALLHDVIEDTPFSKQDIIDAFGHPTAHLVDGVTKLVYEKYPNKQAALVATFRKMMKTMTVDFRVVLIKLSDRLHNLSTMADMPAEMRIKKADESFSLYIPLARRMGMNQMRRNLQELALTAKYPWRSKVLKKVLAKYTQDNEKNRLAILESVIAAFEKNALKASIFHWPKNFYRLYLRLKQESYHLNAETESLDIRILVKTRAECYHALCILHELYPPKIGSFKDFIATPKVYGFQALQTCLLTPSQQLIKIQIQTHNMFQVAQYGVTATWRNPNLKKSADVFHKALKEWIKQVDEIYRNDADTNDFYQDIQADLFLKEIYVSTPKGQSIILPYGSNSIDFAYAIHSDLGNHCAEARVDGKKVSLSMPLYNGATIQIFRSEQASPRASWENIAVTAKAKANIRAWLRKRKTTEFISLGQDVFQAALEQYQLTDSDIAEEKYQKLLHTLKLTNKTELWSAIGKGKQCGRLIVHRLFCKQELPSIPKSQHSSMLISGTEGLLVNLQNCCHPIPDDRITAKISKVNGLEIHRVNCPTLPYRISEENDYLAVSWTKTNNTVFTVPLIISAENHVGMLSTITALMKQYVINIENLTIESEKRGTKMIRFVISVSNRKHLHKIMNTLRKKEGIVQVERPFSTTML
jgi:RelA/SpoT family (p)ppGpp synthetase